MLLGGLRARIEHPFQVCQTSRPGRREGRVLQRRNQSRPKHSYCQHLEADASVIDDMRLAKEKQWKTTDIECCNKDSESNEPFGGPEL